MPLTLGGGLTSQLILSRSTQTHQRCVSSSPKWFMSCQVDRLNHHTGPQTQSTDFTDYVSLLYHHSWKSKINKSLSWGWRHSLENWAQFFLVFYNILKIRRMGLGGSRSDTWLKSNSMLQKEEFDFLITVMSKIICMNHILLPSVWSGNKWLFTSQSLLVPTISPAHHEIMRSKCFCHLKVVIWNNLKMIMVTT